jgi:hypothetical protein
MNVPDRCRRRLLAQRIRGWWTPIVDDRERKGSQFSVPNASIGEYASIETLNPFCDHDCSSNSSVSLWLFRRLLRSYPFDKASSAAFCFSSYSRVYFPIAQLFTSDLQCSRSWDGWMVVVFGARNLLQELLLRAMAWVVVQCRAEHPLRADFSCFSNSASCIQWR